MNVKKIIWASPVVLVTCVTDVSAASNPVLSEGNTNLQKHYSSQASQINKNSNNRIGSNYSRSNQGENNQNQFMPNKKTLSKDRKLYFYGQGQLGENNDVNKKIIIKRDDNFPQSQKRYSSSIIQNNLISHNNHLIDSLSGVKEPIYISSSSGGRNNDFKSNAQTKISSIPVNLNASKTTYQYNDQENNEEENNHIMSGEPQYNMYNQNDMYSQNEEKADRRYGVQSIENNVPNMMYKKNLESKPNSRFFRIRKDNIINNNNINEYQERLEEENNNIIIGEKPQYNEETQYNMHSQNEEEADRRYDVQNIENNVQNNRFPYKRYIVKGKKINEYREPRNEEEDYYFENNELQNTIRELDDKQDQSDQERFRQYYNDYNGNNKNILIQDKNRTNNIITRSVPITVVDSDRYAQFENQGKGTKLQSICRNDEKHNQQFGGYLENQDVLSYDYNIINEVLSYDYNLINNNGGYVDFLMRHEEIVGNLKLLIDYFKKTGGAESNISENSENRVELINNRRLALCDSIYTQVTELRNKAKIYFRNASGDVPNIYQFTQGRIMDQILVLHSYIMSSLTYGLKEPNMQYSDFKQVREGHLGFEGKKKNNRAFEILKKDKTKELAYVPENNRKHNYVPENNRKHNLGAFQTQKFNFGLQGKEGQNKYEENKEQIKDGVHSQENINREDTNREKEEYVNNSRILNANKNTNDVNFQSGEYQPQENLANLSEELDNEEKENIEETVKELNKVDSTIKEVKLKNESNNLYDENIQNNINILDDKDLLGNDKIKGGGNVDFGLNVSGIHSKNDDVKNFKEKPRKTSLEKSNVNKNEHESVKNLLHNYIIKRDNISESSDSSDSSREKISFQNQSYAPVINEDEQIKLVLKNKNRSVNNEKPNKNVNIMSLRKKEQNVVDESRENEENKDEGGTTIINSNPEKVDNQPQIESNSVPVNNEVKNNNENNSREVNENNNNNENINNVSSAGGMRIEDNTNMNQEEQNNPVPSETNVAQTNENNVEEPKVTSELIPNNNDINQNNEIIIEKEEPKNDNEEKHKEVNSEMNAEKSKLDINNDDREIIVKESQFNDVNQSNNDINMIQNNPEEQGVDVEKVSENNVEGSKVAPNNNISHVEEIKIEKQDINQEKDEEENKDESNPERKQEIQEIGVKQDNREDVDSSMNLNDQNEHENEEILEKNDNNGNNDIQKDLPSNRHEQRIDVIKNEKAPKKGEENEQDVQQIFGESGGKVDEIFDKKGTVSILKKRKTIPSIKVVEESAGESNHINQIINNDNKESKQDDGNVSEGSYDEKDDLISTPDSIPEQKETEIGKADQFDGHNSINYSLQNIPESKKKNIENNNENAENINENRDKFDSDINSQNDTVKKSSLNNNSKLDGAEVQNANREQNEVKEEDQNNFSIENNEENKERKGGQQDDVDSDVSSVYEDAISKNENDENNKNVNNNINMNKKNIVNTSNVRLNLIDKNITGRMSAGQTRIPTGEIFTNIFRENSGKPNVFSMTNDNKEELLKNNNKKNTVNTSNVNLNVTNNNITGRMSAGQTRIPTSNIFTNIFRGNSGKPNVFSMTNDNKEEGLKIMSNNKKNTVNTSKVRLNVTDNNASGKMSAGRMPVPTGNIFTNIWQTKSVQPKVSSTSNDNKDMNNDFDLFGRLNSFGLNTNKNTHKEGIKPFDTGNPSSDHDKKLNNFFNTFNKSDNNKQNQEMNNDFDLFGRLNSFGPNTNKNTHKEGIKPFDTGNQKLNNFFNDPLNEPNNNKQNKKPGLDDFDPDFEF